MNKKSLNELLEKDLVIGYVYGYDGERQVFYFEKSPANTANFIMLHKEHADHMILTDLADRLIYQDHLYHREVCEVHLANVLLSFQYK